MMSRIELEKVEEILQFEQDYNRFVYYLAAMIAVVVSEEKGWTGRYLEAFHSYEANPLRAYLPNDFPFDDKLIESIAPSIVASDGKDFLTSLIPGLFCAKPEQLLSFLKVSEVKKKRDLLYLLIRIFCVVYLNNSIRFLKTNQRSQETFDYSYASVEEYKQCILSCFTKWYRYDQYKRLMNFEGDTLFGLWLMISSDTYKESPISMKGISNIKRKAGAAAETADDVLDLIEIAKSDVPMKTAERAYYQVLKNIEKVPTSNLIKAVFFSSAVKTIAMECSFAFSRFCKAVSLRPQGRTIVFNANPDFVHRVFSAHLYEKVYFVFDNLKLAQLYKRTYSTCNFVYHNEENILLLVEEYEEYNKWCRDRKYKTETCVDGPFDLFFWFYRGGSEKMYAAFLQKKEELMGCGADLYFLLPNAIVDKSVENRKMLIDGLQCKEICILPPEAASAPYKKNLFLCMTRRQEAVPNINVTRYYLFESNEMHFICPAFLPVQIPADTFATDSRTVIKLWEGFIPKEEAEVKKRYSRRFSYSLEIVIDYSFSKGVANYRYYALPTEKQRRVAGSKARGKLLYGPKRLRRETVEELENEFRKIVFFDEVNRIICDEIQEKVILRNKPVSLKTFWFCSREKLKKASHYRDDYARKLFESERLSALMSDGEYSLEEYRTILGEDFRGCSEKEIRILWQQLNRILNYAKELHRFYPNPVDSYVQTLVNRDKGLIRVRASLAKRSYELREERVMLRHMFGCFKEDRRLVLAAISFFCGMRDREICALSWGDYQPIAGTDRHQFWITRTYLDGRAVMIDTNEKFAYRRVPIVRELDELLQEYREIVFADLKKHLGDQAEDELKKCPIVAQKLNHSVHMEPGTLRAVRKELEALAGIDSLVGEAAGKETDFNEYGQNRFYTNFRYRARQTCQMTDAEAKYLRGIAMKDTFSVHYCDYVHDCSQLKMCDKLKRWSSLHFEEGREMVLRERLPARRKNHIIGGRRHPRSCVELDLTLTATDDSAEENMLMISVSGNGGTDVQVRRIKEEL